MVTIVRRKPIEVWSVSAVPTACGGATSVTSALNCAESATTKNPQTSVSAKTSGNGARNAGPAARAHAPLASIARITTARYPMRPAAHPPQRQPSPPTPITAKPARSSARDPTPDPDAMALAVRYAGTQVHIAYSSHM